MLERYRDQKYLSQYDLCVDLFERFDLNVTDVVPIRNVYLLSTDKGEKILKKIDYSIEELQFIYSAVKYVRNKFPRVLDYVTTINGEIYTLWNSGTYCVMDLVEGRECDVSNPIDLKIASTGIAELHSASEGFRSKYHNKYACGKLIENFKRRTQEMQFFKNIANIHEIKNNFDSLFLNHVDYYINQMEKSIDILEKSPYYKLCSEEEKVVLCHHDLAYHNILISNELAHFVDFDYCIIDLKVHDLCNFISKVIKNFAFDVEKAEAIINDYSNKNSLDRRELEVLHGMLCFPEDFYAISRDYYTRRKEWSDEVFFDRLNRKCEFEDDRGEFLEEFKKAITQ